MSRKASFINFIQLWAIVFLIVVGFSIIVLDITVSYRDFNVRAEQMRAGYISRQKEMVKQEVNRVFSMVNYEKGQSEAVTKEGVLEELLLTFPNVNGWKRSCSRFANLSRLAF
ncbi:MAG: hypothetical protein U9Q58_02385 [Pseudomonadota bacterium]|nr:hypothetical protein [Pseudomonadota bacterium]